MLDPLSQEQDIAAPEKPAFVPLRLPYKTYDDVSGDDNEMYDPTDVATIGRKMRSNTLKAITHRFPVTDGDTTLTIERPAYTNETPFTLKDQKDALLNGKTLAHKLYGDVVLTKAGEEIGRSRKLLAAIPAITERGTFIRNGSEWGLRHTFQMRPGIYTRTRKNGEGEAFINSAQTGEGTSSKILLNPDNGLFTLKVGTRGYGLLPLLEMAGVKEDQIRAAWGDELTDVQKKKYGKVSLPDNPYNQDYAALWNDRLSKTTLDAKTTERTIGYAAPKLDGTALLKASGKLLSISRGEDVDRDNRDSLEFQKILGPADYVAERIVRDGGGLMRQTMLKLRQNPDLSKLPPGLLQPHINSIFTDSGHAGYIEGASPLESHDFMSGVSRMGEGGIGDLRAAPDDARNVQNSFAGFIDPIKTPERGKTGLDVFLTYGVRKDDKGNLFSKMMNARTGKLEYVNMADTGKLVIATPEYAGEHPDKYIDAFNGGKEDIVKKKDVDYFIPDSSRMFGTMTGTIPGMGGIAGNRVLMACKYPLQALSLLKREAPLVRRRLVNENDEESTTERELGVRAGARFAPANGKIIDVTPDSIVMMDGKGKQHELELYNDFPVNRKGFLFNTPKVNIGDKVKAGQLLADSNYTDGEGNAAMGVNLRTAYMNYKGYNYADAIVCSESAARTKLASTQMIKTRSDLDKDTIYDKNRFFGLFRSNDFTKDQLDKLDDTGVVQVGQTVHKGDPLIMAVGMRTPSVKGLSRKSALPIIHRWEHEEPGIITDIGREGGELSVYAKTVTPSGIGDKISNRFGAKGVLSMIVPDHEMPTDSKGRPMELLLSPIGLINRSNPSQLYEAQLGKIAEHTGQPQVMDDFVTEDHLDKIKQQLADNGLSAEEDLLEPGTGRVIPKVMTGITFQYKLKHMAEDKYGGRGTGAYSSEDVPLGGGGGDGARRFGSMEYSALQGHNAQEVLRDGKLIRGQRNDEFWRDFRAGKSPRTPGMPLVHDKFFAHLKAAGVNVEDRDNGKHIYAMTDSDVQTLTGKHKVMTPNTFDQKSFEPIPGGLFDPGIFGADGRQWGYIDLPEPIVNPMMVDALARVVGMPLKQMDAIASGAAPVDGKYGAAALSSMLSKIDVDRELNKSISLLSNTNIPASKKDSEMKRYRALAGMKLHGKTPTDFMMSRIPVLPAVFRQVSSIGDTNISADANFLYKKALDAVDDFNEAKQELPDELLGSSRASLYRAVNAVTGLEDPEDKKLQQKNVGGVLEWAFGKTSPKLGSLHRKVFGTLMDTGGRGVVAPEPKLGMNEIGIPENVAWDTYEPFIVRRMVQRGMNPLEAVRQVVNRSDDAKRQMEEEMKTRPVLANRAPTLHRFNIMAFMPKLVEGSTIRANPYIIKPFGLDHDGDTMALHVPVSTQARKEALDKMLPEHNLISPRNYKAHYLPLEEYAQGLFLAGQVKKDTAPVDFATRDDAIRAYRRGLLDINTPVNILNE